MCVCVCVCVCVCARAHCVVCVSVCRACMHVGSFYKHSVKESLMQNVCVDMHSCCVYMEAIKVHSLLDRKSGNFHIKNNFCKKICSVKFSNG